MLTVVPRIGALLALAGLAVFPPGCGIQEHPHAKAITQPMVDAGPAPVPTIGGGSDADSAGDAVDPAGSEADAAAPSDGTSGARDAPREPIALSGITININGVDVPKEHVIAFIHFGHSNMSGRAIGPDALRPFFFTTSPGAWMYHTAPKAWELAVEPKTAGDVGNVMGTTALGQVPGTSGPEDQPRETWPYASSMPRKLSKPRPRQGARLAALRRTAGLTQAELAELVGETQRNIAYWEQADKPPRSDVVPRLASVLGVSVETLLTAEGELAPGRPRGPVGRARKAFEKVAQLPRRQQDKIIEMVEAFVAQFDRKAS